MEPVDAWVGMFALICFTIFLIGAYLIVELVQQWRRYTEWMIRSGAWRDQRHLLPIQWQYAITHPTRAVRWSRR